jgi:maltooligosyltrehalose synthase
LADKICGFARVHNELCAVIVIPRLLAASDGAPDWADTTVNLPKAFDGARWRNMLSADHTTLSLVDGALPAQAVFRSFPVPLHYG